MERNAKAPLSPHEESVLQRLASGGDGMLPMVPDRHVHRLQAFDLVSKQGDLLILTVAGKVRAAALLNRIRMCNRYDHMRFRRLE